MERAAWFAFRYLALATAAAIGCLLTLGSWVVLQWRSWSDVGWPSWEQLASLASTPWRAILTIGAAVWIVVICRRSMTTLFPRD